MTTTIPEHQGLGRADQGNQPMFGTVGHWHLRPDGKKDWVKGDVNECGERSSDEALLAQVREATEAHDPTPESLMEVQGHWHHLHEGPIEPYEVSVLPEEPDPLVGVHPIDKVLEGVSDEDAPEALRQHLSALAGHEVTMARVEKPQRGGKRTCPCTHSESRHNASGTCRTCECSQFRVEA